MKINSLFPFLLIICLVGASCEKKVENDYNEANTTVVKEWTLPVLATNTVPLNAGRTDSGMVHIILRSDNSLHYDVELQNFKSGDAIKGARLRAADVISNGPTVLELGPRITNNYIEGIVTNVRQSLVDSLIDNKNDLYFEIYSANLPSGVARVQLNTSLILSAAVNLLGTNEVPPVATTTKGVAYLKLTSNMVLYSLVTVSNVEPNDAMILAHIHKGAAGTNGPIIVPLVTSPADFGVSKKFVLDQQTFTSMQNDALYVNAHSVNYPAGKIRGQLR